MCKILFLCPDTFTPVGGIKQIYRQVDILNEAGFDACVLHNTIDKKAIWFENKTKILYNQDIFEKLFSKASTGTSKMLSSLKKEAKNISRNIRSEKIYEIASDDIIVIPEIWALYFEKIRSENPVVIFNQNCYNTVYFLNDDYSTQYFPFEDKRIVAQIVVSDDSKKYLDYFFNPSKVFRIFNGVNKSLFFNSGSKSRVISFMPRKLKEDAKQVIGILQSRKKIKGWELLPIDNMSEEQVAAAMRKSAIFLSFNYQEGFGLPPAEAMACGCAVIGYSGRGADEYFNDELSFKVNERDIIDFAKKVEFVINLFENDQSRFQNISAKASEFIHSKYSEEKERSSIIHAWRHIVQSINSKTEVAFKSAGS